MKKLVVKDLHASVGNSSILNGINLELKPGEIHVLMGQNGSGKSTLANVLMGSPKYRVNQGSIMLDGRDITNAPVDERARLGLFLSFQYPSEVSGVTLSSFLRTAYNSVNKKKLDVMQFHALLAKKMQELHINPELGRRYLNEGFSGGEKKRSEILQMAVLQPKYCILDEIDSGLDVTAIKAIGEGIKNMQSKARAILIITHYCRILHHLAPDKVSIMHAGRIVRTGSSKLAFEIEKHGFTEVLKHAN